ncbi:MAG: helix-turn-helix transcriptional regulator, partial [Mariprofundaceae bacterium]
MTFGERLKKERNERGLTQSALAKKAGVTKATISALELGYSKQASAEVLLKLSRALGVNPEWLVTGKGPRRIEPSADGQALPEDARELALKYLALSDSQKAAVRAV